MSIIPWGKKKEDGLSKKEDVLIYEESGSKSLGIHFRPKSITIAGKTYQINPIQLIRMIKQVTQTIGEYKAQDNPYASYAIGSLRKIRGDMVSDLEHHFGIHWNIDEETGKSQFFK